MSTTCTSAITHPGNTCDSNNIGAITKLALVKRGTTIATSIANLATYSTWTTLIQDEDCIPLPDIIDINIEDEEDVKQTTNYGIDLKIRAGKRKATYMMNVPLCVHKKLRTLSDNKWDIVKFDSNGHVYATEVASDDYRGFTAEVDIEKMMTNDGTGQAANTPIQITEVYPGQFDDNGVEVDISWSATDLNPLIEVVMTESGTSSASAATVTVYEQCGGNSSGVKQYAVTGLVTGDFQFVTAAGATISQTGITDNGDGSYDFTFDADLETCTCSLVDPSSMTTNGYKTGTAATITVA